MSSFTQILINLIVFYSIDAISSAVASTRRINIGAHRRLEVKVRTRKLLAFGAARRDRAASVMQASQNRIATITGEVDYEQVCTCICWMM